MRERVHTKGVKTKKKLERERIFWGEDFSVIKNLNNKNLNELTGVTE